MIPKYENSATQQFPSWILSVLGITGQKRSTVAQLFEILRKNVARQSRGKTGYEQKSDYSTIITIVKKQADVFWCDQYLSSKKHKTLHSNNQLRKIPRIVWNTPPLWLPQHQMCLGFGTPHRSHRVFACACVFSQFNWSGSTSAVFGAIHWMCHGRVLSRQRQARSRSLRVSESHSTFRRTDVIRQCWNYDELRWIVFLVPAVDAAMQNNLWEDKTFSCPFL